MQPLIVGNWKMHGLASGLDEIEVLGRSLRTRPVAADVLICPPATLLTRAVLAAAGGIGIGGQDCDSESAGAFTGDISAAMLKDAGASAVIVGHSERRQRHSETNALVAAKTRAAWRAGLMALICIGENQAQRSAGRALSVCGEQLAGSAPSALGTSAVAIGYEPLWAIGSGRLPSLEEITQVHAHIRQCLVAHWGVAGQWVRILYGGSVTADNAREILLLPEVGGVLVGGESLDARDFEAICRSVPPVGHGHSLCAGVARSG